MEDTVTEGEVLKLIHPGRHVEIHREPVSAAEIMRRNPRHCITRPDVFKNPLVVVRPESILVPGKVFFIVPNRTIYRLLKAHEKGKQSSSQKNQSGKTCRRDQLLRKTSPSKSMAGMTPKNQTENRRIKKQPQSMFQEGFRSWNEDGNEKLEKLFQVKCWPEVNLKKIKPTQTIEQEISVGSIGDIKSYHERKHRCSSSSIDTILSKNQDGDEADKSSNQETTPRSCLRKPGSHRKSLGLRVTFALPEEDDERPSRIIASQKYTGHLAW